MTEEEAMTKWCPMARPAAMRPNDCGEVRGNRDIFGGFDPGARCIASSCMAWRKMAHISVTVDGSIRETLTENEGYCGLAGEP